MAQLRAMFLYGLLVFLADCGNPLPQALAFLAVTATPSALSVGSAAVLKAVAHLSDGSTQDVTAATQWTLSNSAVARMSNGAISTNAPGVVTVQAAYFEAKPAGTSPASADTSPLTLTASTQVTITAAPSTPSARLRSPGMHRPQSPTASPSVTLN